MTKHNNRAGRNLCSLIRLTAFMLVMAFSCPAFAVSPDVVISQVYGGGGNSGATYKNDFIELFNRGTSPVSLNGWSVQYASAAGTSWQVTNLTNVTLQPGQYYLIQEAAGTGGSTNLPTPDVIHPVTGSIALSASNGKVALVTNTTQLSGACPTGIKDLVGYGTANCSETAAVAALTNTTAALRNTNSCTDTDNNSTDFSTGTPNPRNTATALNVCSEPNTYTLTTAITGNGGGSISGVTNPYTKGNTATITATPSSLSTFTGWSGCSKETTPTISVLMDGSKTCTANFTATAPALTIFHVNDTHARLTPHKMIIPTHGTGTGIFEDVGGAAYMAGKMLQLTAATPNSLVIDAGDISEGNPLGDMNGNGSMTGFYTMLSNKLKTVSGRNGRGMDAVVVGNHDVRDVSYVTNLLALKNSGVPVLSANVRSVACAPAGDPLYDPNCKVNEPFFAPTAVRTVNGKKIGIIGYTNDAAEVGTSLKANLQVVKCAWSGSSVCNISDYVKELRDVQKVDLVVLAAHIGQSFLVDPAAPLLADNGVTKLPEVAVTGHWHTIADTVWQPEMLNYKTIFTEAGSYMKYIGELQVTDSGRYWNATNHVIRNADIIPDPDVQAFVASQAAQYKTSHNGQSVYDIVGYTADNLMLDNDMKWWSADEYPWSGNNSAGQWICDAMRWKAEQLFGQCDLAIETGGGVRADIPAGPVNYLQIYETFPWNDDTFVRIEMTGQEIVDFLKKTNMNTGFSSALHVKAYDGVAAATDVLFNGSPINLTQKYTVAVNNYMMANPPGGAPFAANPNPRTDPTLCREGIVDFMRSQHPNQASGYTVGGPRYELNTEYSGGYRAVVTMATGSQSNPTYETTFIRFLSATPETLARRGSAQVPADLVNADGTINPKNRLSENELYRSFLGFKTDALKAGDIIETWGKGSFYGGNPEFVDQEGVYADGVEFKIVGRDDSLAKPVFMPSIASFWNDEHKNRYVQFLAKKSATANTVTDQYGTSIKLDDKTGYTYLTVPGNTGDTVLVSGIPTMESFGMRFRCDSIATSALPLPVVVGVTSHVDPVPAATINSILSLSATTSTTGASQVQYFARFSTDNSSWSSWAPIATSTVAPYTASLNLTNYGYYEFYSQASSGGTTESAPAAAQAATRYSASPAYFPTMSLDNLYQNYDGNVKTVAVTTIPVGVSYDVTYNGSPTAPVAPGTYTVTATLTGSTISTSGMLEIGKGLAKISLGNLNQTYDGSPKSASIGITPSGIAYVITYNGSTTPPVAVGTYTVVATINDPNYQGSATETLTISEATAAPVPALGPFGILGAAALMGAVSLRKRLKKS